MLWASWTFLHFCRIFDILIIARFAAQLRNSPLWNKNHQICKKVGKKWRKASFISAWHINPKPGFRVPESPTHYLVTLIMSIFLNRYFPCSRQDNLIVENSRQKILFPWKLIFLRQNFTQDYFREQASFIPFLVVKHVREYLIPGRLQLELRSAPMSPLWVVPEKKSLKLQSCFFLKNKIIVSFSFRKD